MKKTALITGISSQDGAYLSKLLLEGNYHVVGLVRSSGYNSLTKLKYLDVLNDIQIVNCDLLDGINLSRVLKETEPNEIYNLAAQSSVSHSFGNPFNTLHFNCNSVLNLLELLRVSHRGTKFLQAVSSDIYSGNKVLPITENSEIVPQSPYAISKAFDYWTVKSYRDSYSMFCSNAVLFNHESYLRGDDFFIKKVIKSALLIKNNKLDVLKLGNIDVKRDFGYAPDYVKAMWLMLQSENADDYCICSGVAILLRDIVEYVFDYLKISKDKIVIDKNLYRPVDIAESYGDNSKIKSKLKWEYEMSFFSVLDAMIIEEQRNLK